MYSSIYYIRECLYAYSFDDDYLDFIFKLIKIIINNYEYNIKIFVCFLNLIWVIDLYTYSNKNVVLCLLYNKLILLYN